MRVCTLLVLSLLCTPSLFAQRGAAKNSTQPSTSAKVGASRVVVQATLLGQLNPGSAGYRDLWGYTDPETGREYALLCGETADGLYIIDITEQDPVEVAFVPGLPGPFGSSRVMDVKVYGQYAYLIHETSPVLVLDLSDPADPQPVGSFSSESTTYVGAHNAEINGDYLYLINNGILIHDLAADPIAPPLVHHYTEVSPHDVHVRDGRAYLSAFEEGIHVLDVSDPSAPTLETIIQYPAIFPVAHNACSTEDGSYLYVGDESGSAPWTRAFDVRDLDDVQLTSDLIVDERAKSHNCYVEGDFLFIAHYTEGLQVFDVGENPASPERVAFYDTYEEPDFGFAGAWGVYPYFESGKVIVSDMQSGLFVIGVQGFTDQAVDVRPGPAESAGELALEVFPNPTAGRATLRYQMPEAGRFRLALYDVLGREVVALAGGDGIAGHDEVAFDTRALGLAPGLYLARLETPSAVATARLTVAQ